MVIVDREIEWFFFWKIVTQAYDVGLPRTPASASALGTTDLRCSSIFKTKANLA